MEVEHVSMIVIVDLKTHRLETLELLNSIDIVNKNIGIDANESLETSSSQINQLINEEDGHIVLLIIRYPSQVLIPLGAVPFETNDVDNIMKIATESMAVITQQNDGALAYRIVSYTNNRLLDFAFNCACNNIYLQKQLADAEASVLRH